MAIYFFFLNNFYLEKWNILNKFINGNLLLVIYKAINPVSITQK